MSALPNDFSAVWRSGSSTQEIDLGVSLTELELDDAIRFPQGWRIKVLYRYWADGSYQVVWEKGSGTQFWIATNDWDKFKAEESKRFNQGLRFKYFNVNDNWFTAVWHSGSGGQFWLANVSFNEFKQKDHEFRSQGFRLMKMNDYAGQYSGFWQPGSENYSWISTADLNQFNDAVKSNAAKGRLAASFGGSTTFNAVFHELSGTQKFEIDLDEKTFSARAKELFKENFHVVDLNVAL